MDGFEPAVSLPATRRRGLARWIGGLTGAALPTSSDLEFCQQLRSGALLLTLARALAPPDLPPALLDPSAAPGPGVSPPPGSPDSDSPSNSAAAAPWAGRGGGGARRAAHGPHPPPSLHQSPQQHLAACLRCFLAVAATLSFGVSEQDQEPPLFDAADLQQLTPGSVERVLSGLHALQVGRGGGAGACAERGRSCGQAVTRPFLT